MTTQNNSRPPRGLSVRILDKDYPIACPPGAETDLQLSAQYLDKQMRLIRRSGKVVGLDRIAIMAGLNTAHELLKATRAAASPAESASTPTSAAAPTLDTASPLVNEKLTELKNRIDEALSAQPTNTTREATPSAEALLWPEEENSFQVNALEVEY